MSLLTNPLTIVVVVVGIILFLRKWKQGGKVSSELLSRNLSGKTVIVTGSNTGIGFETAQQLAKQKATVIVACRDERKGRDAVSRIKQSTGSNQVSFSKLDLGDLSSVKAFAKSVEKEDINYLINNAGIMMCPHNTTKDGLEIQLGTNHIGHMYLTQLLIDNLKKNKARIVNVSSLGHQFCNTFDFDNIQGPCKMHNPYYLYGRSKLANILFTNELQRRYGADGIVSYSLHPGNVATELARHFTLYNISGYLSYFVLKTPWEGCQTTLFACLCDATKIRPGAYLSDCAEKTPTENARNEKLGKQLWEVTEKELSKFK
ncbi:retinol dehydrogenase [Acrasis kona]|uniref:Retinol dehydrogenase n=1 Tax=Acrasis kona TaxID=1008807 RepID=A0AAW2ZEQ7_9EUKA